MYEVGHDHSDYVKITREGGGGRKNNKDEPEISASGNLYRPLAAKLRQ